MEKFKEMVEAKLNGESAKDLVSGIKITETRVGDFFLSKRKVNEAAHQRVDIIRPNDPRAKEIASRVTGKRLWHEAVISGGELTTAGLRSGITGNIVQEPVVLDHQNKKAYSVHPHHYGNGLHGHRYFVDYDSAIKGEFVPTNQPFR